MRGSVRRRGDSWEHIVDTGMATRQRCTVCNAPHWVERRPLDSCPKCGGALRETEERRRAIKGGFATRKECQATMNKLLVAVEQQSYSAPTKATVRQYLTKEWLPAAKSTIRESTHNSYVQHVDCHVVPFIGTVKLQKVTGATLNGLYAKLAESGRKNGKKGLSPATIHHVHACLHRAFRDAVRWGQLARNPADSADPPHQRGTERREMKTWTAEQLGAFLKATKDDRLHDLWHVLAMTGMRRGEALGLKWDDVDLEAGRLSVRRALTPYGREVVVSETKTARGRRSIALDPETVAVLKAQAARQLTEQSDWQ
jgi:integrase